MDTDQYASAMMLVRRYWQNFKPVPGTFDSWLRQLGDLDYEALVAALDALAVSNPDFPPGPGAIRRRALELTGARVPAADEALAEVYATIARIGSYGTPEWSHPAIEAAVNALGGWRYLCLSEDPMADRAHFLKVYGTAEARHTAEALMPPSVAELVRKQLDLSAGRVLELEAGSGG